MSDFHNPGHKFWSDRRGQGSGKCGACKLILGQYGQDTDLFEWEVFPEHRLTPPMKDMKEHLVSVLRYVCPNRPWKAVMESFFESFARSGGRAKAALGGIYTAWDPGEKRRGKHTRGLWIRSNFNYAMLMDSEEERNA